MRIRFFRWGSFLLAFTVGCSGSAFKFAATPTPPPLPATSLVVIGNSITQHGADPSIGWTGDWGMAASAEEKDFAHISAASFTMPLTIVGGASAEEDPKDNGQTVLEQAGAAITPRTLVVIELGDNVLPANRTLFQPFYDDLTKEASEGRAFLCLSSYWSHYGPATDQLMQESCTGHGGTWVPIGHIYTDPNNPDYQGPPQFSNSSVQIHPHDWSMAQIADRIYSAGRTYVVGQ